MMQSMIWTLAEDRRRERIDGEDKKRKQMEMLYVIIKCGDGIVQPKATATPASAPVAPMTKKNLFKAKRHLHILRTLRTLDTILFINFIYAFGTFTPSHLTRLLFILFLLFVLVKSTLFRVSWYYFPSLLPHIWCTQCVQVDQRESRTYTRWERKTPTK